MKSFRVEQNQLVRVWQKIIVSVEAENEQEAKEKAKTFADKDICIERFQFENDVKFLDSEIDYESSMLINPIENGGCATIITEFEDGEVLGNNEQ